MQRTYRLRRAAADAAILIRMSSRTTCWLILAGSLLLDACAPRQFDVTVRTPPPPAEIRVIETGGDNAEFWPACFGASAYGCISRIIAPCEEIEVAYTFTQMGESHLDPFRVKRGAMVDQEGKPLTPQDIVKFAKEEGQSIEEGPALAGDRFYLVGEHTERGEIDVFHSGHVQLDYVKCTKGESVFRLEQPSE